MINLALNRAIMELIVQKNIKDYKMGWSNGSYLLRGVAEAALKHFKDKKRIKFYEEIIELFENHDCDTLQECFEYDTALDAALKNT